MNLIFFAVFAACACFVNGQARTCTTPSGGSGECTSIYNCQALLEVLERINKNSHSSQDIELLQKSQCGFQGSSPTVCCPKKIQKAPSPQGSCSTPDGNVGKCISLYSCPHLADMLNPPVINENVAYVQSSICQGSEQYSVCCGPPPGPTLNKDVDTEEGCAAQMTAYPPDPQSECCGVDSSAGNKIYGGNETTVDQYPWLAIIEYSLLGEPQDHLRCGGALISGKYVLTAAHCVGGRILAQGTPKRVRLGEYDTSHEGPDCAEVSGGGVDCTEGVTRIRIEKFIAHPQYNPMIKRNDIGLIRLANTAPFTDFIRPICLPTIDFTEPPNIPLNFTLYAAGWGAVGENIGYSKLKLHVDLPYVNFDTCRLIFSPPNRNANLRSTQICAGGMDGKDSCRGDSGGPLMYQDGPIYQVIGVVSFGPTPCGLDGVPGIYSKVYEYLDWIRSTIVP